MSVVNPVTYNKVIPIDRPLLTSLPAAGRSGRVTSDLFREHEGDGKESVYTPGHCRDWSTQTPAFKREGKAVSYTHLTLPTTAEV